MNIKQISIVIVLSVLILSCAQQKHLQTKWHKAEYKQEDDIPRTDFWYHKKGKLMYLVSNDKENLYIHMKIMDISTVRKILDFGFTVWVDANGTNKKTLGIKFPLAKKERMPGLHIDQRKSQSRVQIPSLDAKYSIGLIGFDDSGNNSIIDADLEADVNGSIGFSEYNELEYSLKFPLQKMGISTLENKIISLNLESGSLDINNSESRPSGEQAMQAGASRGGQGGGRGGRQGGRPGGGSGGMQGSGRGGNQGGTPQIQERQDMATPLKIKIKKIELMFEEPQTIEN